jgi:NAD(P)-dependent dehydrogenase (short-subunit alcohol dehydrogenase family)
MGHRATRTWGEVDMALDVLITGANRGIGLEIARQLSQRGDRVVATVRNPDAAADLRALDVRLETLDVTSADQVARLAAALDPGAFDVLVNNAGVGVRDRPLGELDFEKMSQFFDTNALGAMRVAEALLPHLRRGNTRKILNMTSLMGSISDNSTGGSYAYRASKAALNMLNRSLAIDLAGDGFTCVVLHPGWVQTDMGGSAAPTPVHESAAGLVRLIDELGQEDSGNFFNFAGQELPW